MITQKLHFLTIISVVVFTVDDGCKPNFPRRVADDISFSNITFTPAVVYKAIKSCRNNRTLDPHGFSSSFLKNVCGSLINPLCILFSHIFDSGVLPNQWN